MPTGLPEIDRLPEIRRVFGVDFSGARNSGVNAWIAETELTAGEAMLRLTKLAPLGRLAGGDDRDTVNDYLVAQIRSSEATLWGFDFPFGLPIELKLGGWRRNLRELRRFPGDAKDYGRFLVERSRQLVDTMHIRRITDRETQTPFDCYHYRIIYQTFHGMRDVLGRVAGDDATCVLPFQFTKLSSSNRPRRVVVEACPSSTLKRLGLPHRLYKQRSGKPPTAEQQAVRRTILAAIGRSVKISPRHRQTILSNPGGDALDSVLAAVGSFTAWRSDDHAAVARHSRYRREGRVYA